LPFNYLPTTSTYGKLDIFVLNELRSPETCANSVQILMYCHGGTDFELALPSSNQSQAVFAPQMNVSNDDIIKEEIIGGADEAPFAMKEMEQSIGEAFMSVKQLLNRYNQWYRNDTGTAAGSSLLFYPWYSAVSVQNSTGHKDPPVGGDIFTYLAPCYLFYRGNARIAVTTFQSPDGTVNGALPANSLVTGTYWNEPWMVNGATAITAPWETDAININALYDFVANPSYAGRGYTVATSGTGCTAWEVPYSSTHKTSVVLSMHPGVTRYVDTTDPSQAIGGLELSSTCGFNHGSQNYVAYRAFDDNFHLSYFLGCPPINTART